MQGLVVTGYIDLLTGNHILDHFAVQYVHPWLYPESEPEFDPDDLSGFYLVDAILHGIGLVSGFDVDKPVSVGPFRFPAHDGVQYLFFYLFGIVRFCEVNKMCRILAYGLVRAKRQ